MNVIKPAHAMWDERFGQSALPYGTEPSLYLREKASCWQRGQLVLLPGDGGGRNGVWLARKGLRAISLDFSPKGLERAKLLAAEYGVKLGVERADVTTWRWPKARYDGVVSVYLHLPPAQRVHVHRAMVSALVPGGHLVLEAFHKDQMDFSSGGPRDPAMLFSEDELRSDFAAMDILELRRDRVDLDEGPVHTGPGVLIRLFARAR